MTIIRIGSNTISYDVRGKGTAALLFNHSGASSLAWSEHFLEQLAANLTVVTIDHRGTGHSSLGSTPFTLGDLAADGRAVLREAGINQAVIIGTSMGGAVAQEFALAFPGQVLALVLMGTFAGQSHYVPPDPEVLKVVADILPRWEGDNIERWRRLLPTIYGPAFLKDHADLALELELKGSRFTTAATIAGHGAAVSAFDPYERLPTLTMPTLVIHGTDDPIIPVKNGGILAGRIPGAEYVELRDIGHLPAVERPEEVADLILSFLRRNDI